jgi:hypothetical protein
MVFAASGDLPVGGWLVRGAEAEQCLEAGERRTAPVVSKDELIEVDLEVFRRDAVVGALQPGEVGERSVRARQQPLAVGEASVLDPRPVQVVRGFRCIRLVRPTGS